MTKRNLWKVGALCLLTLGVYPMYWLYATSEEIRRKYQVDIPSFWYLLVSSVVSIVLSLILAFTVDIDAILGYIYIGLFGVVIVMLWWYWNYVVAVSKILKNGYSPILLFIIIFVLDDFMPVYLQWEFNKLDEKKDAKS